MELVKEIVEHYQCLLHLDSKTKEDALNLYKQYAGKQKEAIEKEESIHVLMRCAILTASKMQIYSTVGDQQAVRGCGLSVTQFLRGPPHFGIDYFLANLRKFLDYVNVDNEVLSELQAIITSFAFSLTLFTKYQDVFKKLDFNQLTEKSDHPNHVDNIKRFGWLLFVLAKSHLMERKSEIVEAACILISTLHVLLTNLPSSMKANYLSDSEGFEGNQYSEYCLKTLCEIFNVREREPEVLKFLLESVKKMLTQYKEADVLRGENMNVKDFTGILSFDRIGLNLKKLNTLYEQKLSPEELDERSFILSETRAITPSKLPIFYGRQECLNKETPRKQVSTESKQLRKSQRVLDYEFPKNGTPDTSERGGSSETTQKRETGGVRQVGGDQKIGFATMFKDIKFGMESPYAVKTFPSTPITKGMELNNWLFDNVNKKITLSATGFTATLNKFLSYCGENISDQIKTFLETNLNKVSEALPKATANLLKEIKHLYFRILDELLLTEERKVQSSDFSNILENFTFHKSILVASIETVLLVHYIVQLNFDQILQIVQISAFDFWKIINSYLKFEPQVPLAIKRHFREIELKILNFLGWKKDSPVTAIIFDIIKNEKEKEKNKIIKIQEVYEVEKETPMVDTPEMKEQSDEKKMQAQNQLLTFPSLQNYYASKENVKTEVTKQTEESKKETHHPHELFFLRILHQVAQRICQLSELMDLNNEIKEMIWEAMKHCLSVETDLFFDRHLDQILLCTIYAVCKVNFGEKITFNNIINCYIELNRHASDNIQEIFHQVNLNEVQKIDIIKFYNTVYINRLKTAIISICSLDPEDKSKIGEMCSKPKIKYLAPESPLRENLPPASLNYGGLNGVVRGQGMGMRSPSVHLMTPRTKLLYAFGDNSPAHQLPKTIGTSLYSKTKGKSSYKQALMGRIVNASEQLHHNHNPTHNQTAPSFFSGMKNAKKGSTGKPPLPNAMNLAHNPNPSLALKREISFSAANKNLFSAHKPDLSIISEQTQKKEDSKDSDDSQPHTPTFKDKKN